MRVFSTIVSHSIKQSLHKSILNSRFLVKMRGENLIHRTTDLLMLILYNEERVLRTSFFRYRPLQIDMKSLNISALLQ